MRKKYLLLSSVGLLATGALLAINAFSGASFSIARGSSSWNHYEAVAPTCGSYGIKEYWTDCKGNTTIEEPVGAEIVEKGQPSAADIQYIVDTYGANDERIIAKADHNYVDTLVTDKIGYFGTVCSVCELAGELSSDKMEFADIDFTKATYGAQGGKWGTNVQPTAKTMTYEVTDGNVENEIFLPKINFSLYKSVKFVLSGNVWDARVGLESGSYAFPYSASGVHTGTLSFTVGTNQVSALLECSDGVNQNLTVTDAEILNGNKSVSLFMFADAAYRAITAELTELADSCVHNYVVSTAKIGAEVCTICGEERNYAISLDDVDFTVAQYGAQGGKWGTNVQPTAKTMTFEALQATEGVIDLPRINFNSFAYVKFNVSCGSFAIGAGLSSGNYVLPSVSSSDPASTGVLTLTSVNSNQLKATLVCNQTSLTQSVIIDDQDVVNGNKSVNMYMYCEGFEWQTIVIELTNLAGSCSHNFVADSGCIGKEVCSICYAERGVANPSFDFTSSLYGAYDVYEPWGEDTPQAGWARADSATQIAFANHEAGQICQYHLPKMYFYGYSSITIDITVVYGGVDYSLDHDFATSYTTPFNGYSLKLVFESISQSGMTVKILDAFDFPQVTATCSDKNVLSGVEGFTLFVKGCGHTDYDAFSNFTFVA